MRHQPLHLTPDVPSFVSDRTGDGPLARLFSLCNSEQAREYMPVKRSFRIHGHSTTIRLERAFWTVLDDLAAEEGVTASALITRIHDHCLFNNDKNLASCLRVVCLKHINLGA
ncbi:MAG: ribbon-helix-helix domain-containing protein [Solirubrobacterales bacterium]